jgi:hypothetical protein
MKEVASDLKAHEVKMQVSPIGRWSTHVPIRPMVPTVVAVVIMPLEQFGIRVVVVIY